MTDVRTVRARKLVDAIAVAVGVLVAFVAMPPLARISRDWLGLPEPTAAPLDYPQSRPLIATYWLPWLVAWVVLMIPAIALIIPVHTRRFGVGYAIAFAVAGGMVGLVASWFTWGLG